MEAIEWNDVYKTGIEVIDYQHKRLIQIINDLIEIHEKEDLRVDLIDFVLDELILYTKYHFEKEEIIMSEIKYDQLDTHKDGHGKFVEMINNFKERTVSSDDITSELLHYLKNWITFHIEVEDKKYVDYIMYSPGIV